MNKKTLSIALFGFLSLCFTQQSFGLLGFGSTYYKVQNKTGHDISVEFSFHESCDKCKKCVIEESKNKAYVVQNKQKRDFCINNKKSGSILYNKIFIPRSYTKTIEICRGGDLRDMEVTIADTMIQPQAGIEGTNELKGKYQFSDAMFNRNKDNTYTIVIEVIKKDKNLGLDKTHFLLDENPIAISIDQEDSSGNVSHLTFKDVGGEPHKRRLNWFSFDINTCN